MLMIFDLIIDVPGYGVYLCASFFQVIAVRMEARCVLDYVIQKQLVPK